MDETEFDRTLTMLFNRIDPPRSFYQNSVEGQALEKRCELVILLGAGCSQQYGLPSFLELLTYLWEDFVREPLNQDSKLEVLRDLLDKYWQPQGPTDRKRILEYYLGRGRVKGTYCPAYRRLARLAKREKIKAIVNLNFDTLLEEALEEEKVRFRVATSFRISVPGLLMIYKPHGTIGNLPEDAIDDILWVADRLIKAGKNPTPQALAYIRTDLDSFSKKHGGAVDQGDRLRQEIAAICGESFELLDILGSSSKNDENLDKLISELKVSCQRLRELRNHPVHARNDLILDIANSDLFSDHEEQERAQELLTGYDVLSVGYSGVDAKIAAALRAFPPGKDPRDKKLFFVSTGRPDPRLLLAMAERDSQDLLFTGEDAAFENFMENFDSKHKQWREGKFTERSWTGHTLNTREPTFMTRSEREALANCLKLAMEIRLSLDVAERSATSIEEHGHVLFGLCLCLAKNAGICLSTPERYLLYSASFLHDLGYYRGYGRGRANQNAGWKLLFGHDQMTDELLRERFADDPRAKQLIIPSSYRRESTQDEMAVFIEELLNICAWHTHLEQRPDGFLKDRILKIDGFPSMVRFHLISALFAAAEELPEEHPFLPSAVPLHGRVESEPRAIDDPILDIYLGRKRHEVFYDIQRSRVVGKLRNPERDHPSAAARWLFTMAARFIERLEKIAAHHNGWDLKFVCEHAMDGVTDFAPLVTAALEERLTETVKTIAPESTGEVTSLLDLVAIYTLGPAKQEEPRVSLNAPSLEPLIKRVNERLSAVRHPVQQSLFPIFLKIRRNGPLKVEMERVFAKSFEEIIHPAWRFCGRNWQNGIEATLMARACVDLGSSRFRSEMVSGLRDLLGEKVVWSTHDDPPKAYGHDRCTLCTSRLLFIFSHARRLFQRDNLWQLENNSNKKGLDKTVGGLLRHMISLERDSEVWWGFGVGQGLEGTIRSADYLAWATRAVTCSYAIDQEIGENWLEKCCEIQKDEIEVLISERWDHLLSVNGNDLRKKGAEEPHSFIFGHIALACLDLQRLGPEVRALALKGDEDRFRTLCATLDKEASQIGLLSRLSDLFMWPAIVLRDSLAPSSESAVDLVKLCYDCVYSPVWIRQGRDSGTWGFNVKNTQTLVTSLVAFWRYAYQNEENEQRFKEVFEVMAEARQSASFPFEKGPELPFGESHHSTKGE